MKPLSFFYRKRLLLPLVSLLLVASMTGIAIRRSDTSEIVVYNLTGAPLPPLRVAACQQTRTFPALPEESSFRWKLARKGPGSEVELELAQDPPWRWQGSYLEPRGGYRISLRLWPDGQVEEHRQISWWQRIIKGAPNINE
jgi:hypothetical protein